MVIMPGCLICNTPIEPFISFGKMPIANGFLSPEQFATEYFFDLRVAFCGQCGMVQLMEQPAREQMFNEHYAFYSGTSQGMKIHFKAFAEHVRQDYLKSPDPFVVEIGSNDGIMLQNFTRENIRHLGIEPSANVAEVARQKGIRTICEFFDAALARRIVSEHGQADAFLGANVMCHIPYLHSVIDGVKILLKPDGIMMFEDPYLGDVIEKTSYDQIYDEHVFLFSVTSIAYLFQQHGMEVIDVAPQETHGGSMRYIIAHQGARPVSPRVSAYRRQEEEMGLNQPAVYDEFRRNCEDSRNALMTLLSDIKKMGKRIVGYAATSKSTTIINYCGINADLIEFISDTTPVKQGKYSPGSHIPVRPYEEFTARYPDYALLFAYNHAREIMAKENNFIASGGRWITYVPKVQVFP
jgi:methylation protein EvaC